MQPPPKRALRPTASQPTTAEHYGRQHGIPEHVQAALQNVGRKGRMAVAQGRTFDRTQSYPTVLSHADPFDPFPQPPLSGFMTSQQTYQHAERAVLADEARRRELRPYADTSLPTGIITPLPSVTASSSRPARRSPSPRTVRLDFTPDAIDAEGRADEPGQDGKTTARRTRSREFIKARKRKDEGSETETDGEEGEVTTTGQEDWPIEMDSEDVVITAQPADQDFPPVFQSPQISHPELFALPPSTRTLPSRLVRNMPGRQLGKTVSAPVGGLGRFGHAGRLTPQEPGAEEMDVEDGFDVSEWAASEEF